MFSVRYLSNILSRLTQHHHFCIAYSGGLDSQALLHAMVQWRAENSKVHLRAIHINHGVSPQAFEWEKQAEKICASLEVPITIERLDLSMRAGDSWEEKWRENRYAIFGAALKAQENLLTAHTEDDQAETFLLQLLRGSGIKGLSAMPMKKKLGAGFLLRPLLHVQRQALQAFLEQRKIKWIEDESNKVIRFSRNYLRHEIIPPLRQRWPEASLLIARSAKHCAQAQILLDELAELDLQNIELEETLRVEPLLKLTSIRIRNVLRHWMGKRGFILPQEKHWDNIYRDILLASLDANPVFSWKGGQIRRYQQRLYLLPKKNKLEESNSTTAVQWHLKTPLPIENGIMLVAHQRLGKGLSANIDLEQISVRFRQGGERCCLQGQVHTKTLKKLMQEWQIPPWERDQIPLIYYKEKLAMVVGYGVCASFAAKASEMGWDVEIIRKSIESSH